MPADEVGHHRRVLGLLLIGQHECQAVEERYAYLVERGVERDSGDAQHRLGGMGYGIGLDVAWQGGAVVADTPVMQHHTLRTARRARRINKVREVVGSDVER